MKTRQLLSRLFALAALVALGGCDRQAQPAATTDNSAEPAAVEAAPLRKVQFNMSWLPQGSMAGVIVAIERGFYRESGLEVEAIRGFGGIRTVNELDQGLFEFGYGDPLAVILNRGNGGKTRLIGALNATWPAGLCFVRERHDIRSPADLAGLTVGGGQSSPMQVILPVWLKNNGVDPASVKIMQLDPAVISASVIEGKIDAGECWRGNSRPVYAKRAREAGVTLGSIEYGEFGLDMYGSGLVTRDELIEKEPQTVAGFVRATYRGYAWVAANQDAAAAIMQARFPMLDADVTRLQIAETVELLGDPATAGRMEDARIGKTLAFLAGAYRVEKAPAAADIYTTQFLPLP